MSIPVFYKKYEHQFDLESFKIKSVINRDSKQIKKLILDYLYDCPNISLSDSVAISLALENDDFVNKLVLVNDLSYASCGIALIRKKIEIENLPYNILDTKSFSQILEFWAEEAEEIRVYIEGISGPKRKRLY